MRHALPLPVALLVLALAPAAPAGATAPGTVEQVGPATAVSLHRAQPMTFEVRAGQGVTGVRIGISLTGRTAADGAFDSRDMVDAGPATPVAPGSDLYRWTPAKTSRFLLRPGKYFWQARGDVSDGGPFGDTHTPIRSFELVVPAAARHRGAIPASIGRHGSAAFYLSDQHIPSSVGWQRFSYLTTTSARRWGLHPLRGTSLTAGVRDGWNVVGFNPAPFAAGAGEALGVEIDYGVVLFRIPRRCLIQGGRVLGCTYGKRRYVGHRTVERDIIIDTRPKWQAGPAYPEFDEYDLETVLVHELGHMAGNKRHAQRCATESPMIDALGKGEWWHTPGDWYLAPCPMNGGTAASARSLAVRDVTVGARTQTETTWTHLR